MFLTFNIKQDSYFKNRDDYISPMTQKENVLDVINPTYQMYGSVLD